MQRARRIAYGITITSLNLFIVQLMTFPPDGPGPAIRHEDIEYFNSRQEALDWIALRNPTGLKEQT